MAAGRRARSQRSARRRARATRRQTAESRLVPLGRAASRRDRERTPELVRRPRHLLPRRHVPVSPTAAHCSIADPAAAGDNDKTSYPAFENVADEIETRVALLLADLTAQPPKGTNNA